MKKRFSITAFIIATLIHLFATSLLWAQGEHALAEWKRQEIQLHSIWGPTCAWILQPVMMFVSYYTRHHPSAVRPGIFESPIPLNLIFHGRSS